MHILQCVSLSLNPDGLTYLGSNISLLLFFLKFDFRDNLLSKLATYLTVLILYSKLEFKKKCECFKKKKTITSKFSNSILLKIVIITYIKTFIKHLYYRHFSENLSKMYSYSICS